MIKVGIDAELFSQWGGGIEFIAMISEALESTNMVNTVLIYPKDSLGQKIVKIIKAFYCSCRDKISISVFLKIELTNNKELIDTFKVLSPNTKFVSYYRSDNTIRSNVDRKKQRCAIKNKIDIILPSIKCGHKKFEIPRIGYLFDFQHKYLTDFFDEKYINKREKVFERQIANSKYLIVNSIACRDDIKKFYPNSKCKVIALPFAPFIVPKNNEECDIEKYKLPSKYYMISNQFWAHKNHILAFEALENIYKKGITDLHIVCTGKMFDDKKPEYVKNLLNIVQGYKCKANIHFLGYIPKNDQIEIMRNSIGVIQPTLFEGGPGGGEVYNALCLGVCCLVSDIPVNKEICGYNSVYFFDPKDSNKLADLMLEHRDYKREDEEVLKVRIESNKKYLGQYILKNIINVLMEEKNDTGI